MHDEPTPGLDLKSSLVPGSVPSGVSLSKQLRSAWAKSDSEGRSLSLAAHAADACAVAGYLFEHWLPDSVRNLIGEGRTALLESTGYGVERIGRDVGFASPANFREQFRRLTGVAPLNYRNTFRNRTPATA